MIEGSLEVDNGGGNPFDEGAGDEPEIIEDKGGEGEGDDAGKGEGEGDDKAKLTAKGTKLDPNPESAVHQELANERRLRQQYESVLGNPELLKKYAKESGLTIAEAKAEIKDEVKTFSPDQFKSREDVAKVLTEMQATFQKDMAALREENRSLQGKLTGIEGSTKAEKVANTMKSEIGAVRESYPELDPKNPDYNKELENEIGSLYHELDFDEETKTYRGKVSIAKITERYMKGIGIAKRLGGEQAQTKIITKQSGRVVTSSKGATKDTSESKNPDTAIAQRVAKMFGNKRG